MFHSRIRRVWGHVAIFAWSDLILDPNRKLVTRHLRHTCGWQLRS